jgi:NTE family protein
MNDIYSYILVYNRYIKLKCRGYKMQGKQKKLGLCLSGGGARGAYQIGAVKALEDLGIYEHVACISGASIGSANGAILASSTIEAAKNVWFNIPENPMGEQKSLLTNIKEKKLDLLNQGFYSMQGMDDILLNNFSIENIKHKDFYISISESGDESKGLSEIIKASMDHYVRKNSKAKYLHMNKLDDKLAIQAIKASCSMPGVFPPVIIDGKKYYDGGVFDNTPIQPLIDAGCTTIILINIAFFGTKNTTKNLPKEIEFYEIKNSQKLGGVLDFTSKHSKALFDLGYRDTQAYFKNIKINF